MKETKIIYVQWHFLTHGIAYFKHILSAFASGAVSKEELLSMQSFESDLVCQEEMNEWFNRHKRSEDGFWFDEVYYLYVNSDIYKDIITTYSHTDAIFKARYRVLNEYKLPDNVRSIWHDILENKKIKTLQDQFEYIDKLNISLDCKNEVKRQVWKFMHFYSVEDQIWWFKNYSNIPKEYIERIKFINKSDEVANYSDYIAHSKIASKLLNSLLYKDKNHFIVVNPVFAMAYPLVAFFTVLNSGIIDVTRVAMIAARKEQSDPYKRFKNFKLHSLPSDLVAKIHEEVSKVYVKPATPRRKAVNKILATYLKQGFAILMVGERGTGKSYWARKAAQQQGYEKIITVNCASFKGNVDLAESLLFGYAKGAFTGANKDRDGFFQQARGGILFLDEIHTLDLEVQQKLLLALQTDENNQFTIRKLGGSEEEKVSCIVIFATNRPVEELTRYLLPDFYDRISQLVIELPPLRETREEIPKIFLEEIIPGLKFEKYKDVFANDKRLLNWLKRIPLYGNHRDLQRIAINYKCALEFDEETRRLLKIKSPFLFAKQQYEKYMLQPIVANQQQSDVFYQLITKYVNKEPSEKEKIYELILSEIKELVAKEMIKYAGNKKKAAQIFGISRPTLDSWLKGTKD